MNTRAAVVAITRTLDEAPIPASRDGVEAEANLKRLGRGTGDITVSIFLRDMRCIWRKPRPTPLVVMAIKSLGIKRSWLRGSKNCPNK
jgi:hypothetical protein